MPLSSSSVDRRIPEALSTSRKRNLIFEGAPSRCRGKNRCAPRSARRPLTASSLCRGSLTGRDLERWPLQPSVLNVCFSRVSEHQRAGHFRYWHTKQTGRRLARMSASEGSADIAKSVGVLDL